MYCRLWSLGVLLVGGATVIASDETWGGEPAPPPELARTEVTVDEYRRCVDAGKCTKPDGTGKYYNFDKTDRGGHPVNFVDWVQADAYCTWAGSRLPTDAEWMAAFTNGGKTKYPWGRKAPTCATTVMSERGDGCGRDSTWVACEKPGDRNRAGLCDLGGNLLEWTSTESGSERVIRGGSWSTDAPGVGLRITDAPTHHFGGLGFRCMKP